jgi:hypothetical protein
MTNDIKAQRVTLSDLANSRRLKQPLTIEPWKWIQQEEDELLGLKAGGN